MIFNRLFHFTILTILLANAPAWAWGRRGHSIVCQTAAYLIASEPKSDFLKNHSFDLGYYCNVPDLLWKKPATYHQESFNHYMDIEIFEREIAKDKLDSAFEMDRKAFDKAFPQIPDKAGRAWWRIRELNDQLGSLKDKLMNKELKKDDRFANQADWLVHAGLIGHYVGDMSMPLHVSENHDGQLTHQEGVHSFYEDDLVNDLFFNADGSQLEAEVQKAATSRWKKEQSALAKKSTLELLKALTSESSRAALKLLATDLKVGRDFKKAEKAHKAMIAENLVAGSVYLAEFYRRALGFDFDDNRFYNFVSEPKFIAPPK